MKPYEKKAKSGGEAEREILKKLLAKVSPKNVHPEVDWGKPRGKEVW